MNEYFKNWIDLSDLPRKGKLINWPKTIGYTLKFVYNSKAGEMTIIERIELEKYKVIIRVKDWSNEYIFTTSEIRCCKLYKAFKRSIADTNPELVKYFVNVADAHQYTSGSGKKVKMICQFCGTIKEYSIHDLTNGGFVCDACSDGISWPNKFMYNILKQANVDFKNEVSKSTSGFEWIINGYRYDFGVNIKNHWILIELDGGFHEMIEAKKTDKIKDELANINGCKVIRIDCNYPKLKDRFDFIKTNILQSKIAEIIDLSSIDWDAANKIALQSNIIIAAKLWGDGLGISEISSKLGVVSTTINEYLKTASKLKLCDYNFENAIQRRTKNVAIAVREKKSKHIALYKNDFLINIFYNAEDLAKQSFELYGVHLNRRNVCSVCLGHRKHVGGYTMKYISREEYELLLPQFQTIQNECNLQEVI